MLHFHSRLRVNKSIQMIGKKKNSNGTHATECQGRFRTHSSSEPSWYSVKHTIDRTLPSRTTTLRILLVWTAFELLTVFCLSEFMIMENGQVMLYINIRRETKGSLKTFRAFIWESQCEDYPNQRKTGNSFAIELPAI